jgi:hypothetical protein
MRYSGHRQRRWPSGARNSRREQVPLHNGWQVQHQWLSKQPLFVGWTLEINALPTRQELHDCPINQLSLHDC